MAFNFRLTRFDSILVRLKVYTTLDGLLAKMLFRFHTGSIKSRTFTALCRLTIEFRFHTGSIKSIRVASQSVRL